MLEKLESLEVGDIIKDIDVKNYTTFKVSCKVSYLVKPKTIDNLISLLKFLRMENIRYKVIGNGSNLVFVKDKFLGVLISLEYFNSLEINKEMVKVGAGFLGLNLVMKTVNEDLSGLEFLSGIPGTIGGAIVQNAGAYGGEISNVVESVLVLNPNYELEVLDKKSLNFSYRSSFLKENPSYICLEVTFRLKKGKKEEMLKLIKERKEERLAKQPLEYPSAGSVFRNPVNDSAGKIIEELGFKGKSIGGAMVSLKHANFIVNTGSATGEEIKKLILEIQKKVKEEKEIDLVLEQELVE